MIKVCELGGRKIFNLPLFKKLFSFPVVEAQLIRLAIVQGILSITPLIGLVNNDDGLEDQFFFFFFLLEIAQYHLQYYVK